MVIASVTHSLQDISGEQDKEESYLLEVGRRYSKLNFYKAPWDEIKVELDKVDWDIMKELSTTSPADALAWFHEKTLEIFESLVPERIPGRKSRPRMCRQRRILWRRLAKVKKRLKLASSINKLTQHLQEQWDLESQLRDDFTASNNMAVSYTHQTLPTKRIV